MNHPYRDSTIWAAHRRHRADVKAAYDRAGVVALPDRELRPVAAAANCHRQIRRDAAEDLRGWPRIEPTPRQLPVRDAARDDPREEGPTSGGFEITGPGPGLMVLLPFQPL